MSLVKLSSKSQIVLPAKIRKNLGFHPGDFLQVTEVDGGVMIRKPPISYVDALEECASDLWEGYEEELRRSRDSWDR